ncbi:hypothetical protein XENTR_v10005638 [Xenopus tropicalis]|nr:hypothetical protein XENTR_v10005638 [Xenopus tropicalis]
MLPHFVFFPMSFPFSDFLVCFNISPSCLLQLSVRFLPIVPPLASSFLLSVPPWPSHGLFASSTGFDGKFQRNNFYV